MENIEIVTNFSQISISLSRFACHSIRVAKRCKILSIYFYAGKSWNIFNRKTIRDEEIVAS
jgi:hypothetical protein